MKVEGKLTNTTEVAASDLLEIYRLMVCARAIDAECAALQRQGELAVWAPMRGQEAAQIASAYALGPSDMAFPSYREFGAALARGVKPSDYIHFYRASCLGGLYDPREHGFGLISVPVASQCIHAVGWAMGARFKATKDVSLAYFGDGASSEGDFHEALNFASVFDAPVVFFCQNNGWAISVPFSKQSRTDVATKAQAYGIEGVKVDGNDAVEVFTAVRTAVDRARNESRPTLIEAVTYRIGAHSTADDDSIYRSASEVAEWEKRDPIVRMRTVLEDGGHADDDHFESVRLDAGALAASVREEIFGAAPRDTLDSIGHVFSEISPRLQKQFDALRGDTTDLPAGDTDA